jgi:hypothetical protein
VFLKTWNVLTVIHGYKYCVIFFFLFYSSLTCWQCLLAFAGSYQPGPKPSMSSHPTTSVAFACLQSGSHRHIFPFLPWWAVSTYISNNPRPHGQLIFLIYLPPPPHPQATLTLSLEQMAGLPSFSKGSWNIHPAPFTSSPQCIITGPLCLIFIAVCFLG